MQEQDLNLVKRSVSGLLSNFDYERKELEQRWLKELRTVVRKNESVIGAFVERLFVELYKSNPDRRLGAMFICDHFFQRSHRFRTELLEHIQDLLLFTIEIDPLHYPLPEPPEAATELKKQSLKIIKSWIDKFSKGYSKLSTASQYLLGCKQFDFRQANEQLLAERQRAVEARDRQAEQARRVGEKVQKLFGESRLDIERTLTECRTSIKLIFPDLFKGDGEAPSSATSSSTVNTRLHGYKGTNSLTVVINTDKIDIKETPNNEALVDALKDSQIDLNKHMKSVEKWIKKLIKAGANNNVDLIRFLVSCKAQIEHELKRCRQLNIDRLDKKKSGGSDSEEGDSDFEDVVKEGLELDFLPGSLFEDDKVPDGVMRQIAEMEQKEKRRSNLDDSQKAGPSGWKPNEDTSSKIPKLAYGLDLKYWGQEVEPAQIPRNEFDGHPFWRATDPGDTVSQEAECVYNSRQMTFIGEQPLIKYRCRAPLPSGKLCPRMDLKRCPFHGSIVLRDEMGFPVNELDKESVEQMRIAEERTRQRMEAEEESYLRDVEIATGTSLRTKKKRPNSAYGTKRKRERTQTELSRERLTSCLRARNKIYLKKNVCLGLLEDGDTRDCLKTSSRQYFQKKLLDKRTIKRVTDALTQIQKEKAKKNFSSQFNYALRR